ncbi:MAG: DUF1501 domain-containing protein [Planctomycetota bacterium]|nr:MAG: DUF1501 domain-containing protein [Planctomycetota bacterium]
MLLPLGGSLPHNRRTFLIASGAGLLAAGKARGAAPRRVAKSAIMIWLSGGASHIDTWDMKPKAPREYRGPFEPISTTSPAIQLCEHLPLTAQQAHRFSIVRSVGDHGRGTGDHHAGYYYNLTGHAPDPTFHRLLNARTPYPTDWPSMASVVAAKRPPHPSLPSAITLPQKEGAPEYTRPGQFAARLGIEFDPVFIDGSREKPLDFQVPALSLDGGTSVEHLLQRRELLAAIDRAERPVEQTGGINRYSTHQQKAFTLLTSRETKAAFDLQAEPVAVRERYGAGIMGMSLLLARRLVEASVPFITVFYKANKELDSLCKSGGGWDTHGNNFGCLQDKLLPEFDRPYAALLADLHERGLLDETLVIVSSEMGRRPKIGDPRSGGVSGAGRDHWTSCMSVLLAGGGIQGGQVYGSSDKHAEYPADHPVGPEEIARTVFHAMGIDDLTARDREGRPFPLMDEGRRLYELFG